MLDGTQEREKTEPREKTLEHTPTPESEHKGHPFSKEMLREDPYSTYGWMGGGGVGQNRT